MPVANGGTTIRTLVYSSGDSYYGLNLGYNELDPNDKELTGLGTRERFRDVPVSPVYLTGTAGISRVKVGYNEVLFFHLLFCFVYA